MGVPVASLSTTVAGPWQFDPRSALIGAAAAFLLAWLAYALRHQLSAGFRGLKGLLARLDRYLQASTEENYRTQVAARAGSLALPAHVAPLDDLFVEPRLRILPPLDASTSENKPTAETALTISLRQLLGGHPQVCILGAPGTGRTALLAYLALIAARGARAGSASKALDEAVLPHVQERLPLYLSLPAMDWPGAGAAQRGGQQKGAGQPDAVERLVTAALAAVGGSGRMQAPLRQYLTAGRAVLLADGWDEIPPGQQQQATAWLVGLVEALPGNVWLVGAGERGYAPLTEAGFAPAALVALEPPQADALAERWLATGVLGEESEGFDRHRVQAELRRALRAGAHPIELALRAFVHLSDQALPPRKQGALFERVLDLLLWQEGNPWLLTSCRTALGQMALALQREERHSARREEVEGWIEAALPAREDSPNRAVAAVLRALTGRRGVLRPVGSDRYAFVHTLWQAYFTARQLLAGDPAQLIDQLDDPRWAEVLRFYAEVGEMAPVVTAWLRSPDDLFRARLRTTCHWMSAVPEGVAWRDGAMATLARRFLEAQVPQPVRSALAASLASTEVPGVKYFLKHAAQHEDPALRAAAARGLTRLAEEADLPVFEALVQDDEILVREAALRALADVDLTAAVRLLERRLLESDDALMPVVAEALAHSGEEGIAYLHEAAGAENVMVRRAAVQGLAEAGDLDMLHEVMRTEEQWIVRTAATAAAAQLEGQSAMQGLAPLPELADLPWLISWAASRGEGLSRGPAARAVLLRALDEGDQAARLAVVRTLMLVGRPEDAGLLRELLTDSDPEFASVAFAALEELARRYDLHIE